MQPVEKQWPDVMAMILADVVHRDGATGKFSVLGILHPPRRDDDLGTLGRVDSGARLSIA